MQTFNDNKAGMSGLDKNRIQRIIDENTSPNFDEHEKKRNERIATRIEHNLKLLATFTAQQIAKAQCEMDDLVELLEEGRDLSRVALHVDMDAFYAAVEMRDDPTLRNIPMAVGSDSMLSTSNYAARRFGVRAAMPGFIARKLCPELKIIPCDFNRYRAASHEVRKIFEEYDSNFQMGSLDEAYLDITEYILTRLEPGIRADDIADRRSMGISHKCEVSRSITLNTLTDQTIRRRLDSVCHSISFEDAVLAMKYNVSERVERQRIRYSGECICRLPLLREDEMKGLNNVTTSQQLCRKCGKIRICVQDVVCFGDDVEEIVREMRFRVEQTTGLTCSAGIAPNSMIAKICSDINKPNGQYRVANNKEAVIKFMRDLPIRKVSGIGAVTEAILKGIGVEKCGELYEKRAIISLLFTRCSYEHFLRIALGISTSYTAFFTSHKESKRKSISVERTFHPTDDMKLLLEIAESLCKELIESLSDRGIRGGYSATVKMKFATFDVITRCSSVDYLINEASRLMALCERIIRNELRNGNKQLRLLGVRLSRLLFIEDKVGSVKSLTSFWSTAGKRSAITDPEMDHNEIVMTESETSNDATDIRFHDSTTAPSDCQNSSGSRTTDVNVQRCPICDAELPDELVAVNRHVDECLNRQAIAELQNEVEEVGEVHTASRKRSSKRTQTSPSKMRQASVDGMKKKISICEYFSAKDR